MSGFKLVRKTKLMEYRWEAISAPTGIRPTVIISPYADPIDSENADSIAIQIDTTHASNTATDIDVNVMAIFKGTHDQVRDTTPYAERNIGDGAVKTFLVEPGPDYITLELDNNDAATSAWVIVRVFIRYLVFVAVEDE